MLEWIRKMLGKPQIVQAPEPPAPPLAPSRQSSTTTWQERAAAVGALVEAGQKPTITPIALSSGNPKNKKSPLPLSAGNPLQLRGKALKDFLAQPSGIQRYEAAEQTRKCLGSVDGRHYTQHVPEVKRLLRVGEYEAAVLLLERLVAAVDAEAEFSKGYVPPWYKAALDAARERRSDMAPIKKRRNKKGGSGGIS